MINVAEKSPLEHKCSQLKPLSIIVVQTRNEETVYNVTAYASCRLLLSKSWSAYQNSHGGNRQWRVALKVYRFLFVTAIQVNMTCKGLLWPSTRGGTELFHWLGC